MQALQTLQNPLARRQVVCAEREKKKENLDRIGDWHCMLRTEANKMGNLIFQVASYLIGYMLLCDDSPSIFSLFVAKLTLRTIPTPDSTD